MSNEEKKNKREKSRHKKHYTVLPYITTPLIFVVISMAVVVPMLVSGLNYAVDTVHDAQKVLTIGYNDKDAGAPIATISCRRIGLKSDVYDGINRVALRNGCGMIDEDGIKIAGYSSDEFKPLLKVKLDDVITLKTGEEEKIYRVIDITSKNKEVDKKCIILSTSKDNSPFSYYDNEKLYVIAEEVRYE